MAEVKKMCLEIVEHVDNSGLDYSLTQTPYSIHFSIRKKLSKMYHNRTLKKSPPPGFENSPQNDLLRHKLLNMRFEYEKLFSFYQKETNDASRLKAELVKETELNQMLQAKIVEFERIVNLKETEVVLVKKLKADNTKLQETVEIKSIGVKQLKNEIDA